jgi:uncharacterized protein YkwD
MMGYYDPSEPAGYVTFADEAPSTLHSTVLDSEYAAEAARLINLNRTGAGLPPLMVNPILTDVAQAHSEYMRDYSCFAHKCEGESSPEQRACLAGFQSYSVQVSDNRLMAVTPPPGGGSCYVGEAIAAGYRSPESVVEAWMDSPGHYAILMHSKMTEIGMGYAVGGYYRTYWTADVGRCSECEYVGPNVANLEVVPNPVAVNTNFDINATIDDSETGGSNIYSAVYSIDEGSWYFMDVTDGAFGEPIEEVTVQYAFNAPGVYDICVQGTDEPGNVGSAECLFLAVYDPDGGFVTGGGWFDSPPEAYYSDPSFEGKANFGFVSKYKKDSDIPTGNTEFQFQVADLNFHSEQYDWLVVAGSTAEFKGFGTINGSGAYKFMVWAKDSSPDTFRVKIWEEDESGVEEVIYDNQLGDDDNLDPTTEIGGGNIVVH